MIVSEGPLALSSYLSVYFLARRLAYRVEWGPPLLTVLFFNGAVQLVPSRHRRPLRFLPSFLLPLIALRPPQPSFQSYSFARVFYTPVFSPSSMVTRPCFSLPTFTFLTSVAPLPSLHYCGLSDWWARSLGLFFSSAPLPSFAPFVALCDFCGSARPRWLVCCHCHFPSRQISLSRPTPWTPSSGPRLFPRMG